MVDGTGWALWIRDVEPTPATSAPYDSGATAIKAVSELIYTSLNLHGDSPLAGVFDTGLFFAAAAL